MISIERLETRLHGFNLHDVSLSIPEGEFFILMGPTGAGKTVLLEALVGLVPIKDGRILIGGVDVTRLPPEKRGISIVYQDYALFPHLTVMQNIGYGLHFHRMEKTKAEKRVQGLIEELNLDHLQHRLPTRLSGGELQRVALARALAVGPRVLLLDEPLSALDPAFREGIRHELKRLHRSSNATFLMVTHDFAEALALADRAAVIHGGRIEQIGTMEEIFHRPATEFVADFVGMKNIFPAEFRGSTALIDGGMQIEMDRVPSKAHGHVAIRPEEIAVDTEPFDPPTGNSFRGRVTAGIDHGFYSEVHIQVGEVTLKALITKKSFFQLQIHEGLDVFLSFKSTAAHTF